MGKLVERHLIRRSEVQSRLEAVIQSIELGSPSSADWEAAQNSSQTFLYILRSAHNVNAFQPFTEEQKALNTYLMERLAGRRLCEYAWRLLAQSL